MEEQLTVTSKHNICDMENNTKEVKLQQVIIPYSINGRNVVFVTEENTKIKKMQYERYSILLKIILSITRYLQGSIVLGCNFLLFSFFSISLSIDKSEL